MADDQLSAVAVVIEESVHKAVSEAAERIALAIETAGNAIATAIQAQAVDA